MTASAQVVAAMMQGLTACMANPAMNVKGINKEEFCRCVVYIAAPKVDGADLIIGDKNNRIAGAMSYCESGNFRRQGIQGFHYSTGK
jgi:hypothetical protein